MLKCTMREAGGQAILKHLNSLKHVSLVDAADATREAMINIIDANRKRDVKGPENSIDGVKYTKHLKDVIEVEVLANRIIIGNIDKLNEETPYWKVVNNGGYVPPATHGTFMGGPGSFFAYNADAPFFKPTKPISAMNYIEKTNIWVQAHLRKFFDDAVIKAGRDGRAHALLTIK